MASATVRDEELLPLILRALPFGLQGADTDALSFDSRGGLVLPADVSATLATALTALAEPCVLYRAIDATLRHATPKGLLRQALWSAIRDSLRSYLALISEIEQKILSAPAALGLAACIAMVQSPTLYLRLFRTILEEAAHPQAFVPNVVHSYTLHGDPLISCHARDLHSKVMEPFHTLRAQWESQGSLDGDVFGEFFVEPRDAHEFALVESRVPKTVTLSEARRSFERGKALYFIRVVCGRDNYDGAARTDAEIMDCTHDLLVNENNLLLHLRGMRDYMLLANGNFVDALFRNDTASFLMQPLQSVSQYLASEFFIGTIDDLAAEHLEDQRVLRCIDAYILGLDTAADDRLVWEAFVGKYQLDSEPLRLIVDKAATRKYQRAFATLWRVRLAVYSLTETSMRLRQVGGSSPRAQQLYEVHMVMNKTFLMLQEHLYYNTVGQHWAQLESRLLQAKQLSLNDVKTAHTRYIDAVSAVVSSPTNVKAVQTMTRLALGLQRIVEEQELEMLEHSQTESRSEAEEEMPQLIEIAEAFQKVAGTLALPV